VNAILRRATALVILLLAHSPVWPDELRGRVVGITDGDTITVLAPDLHQFKVRLAGIDAPEKGQAFGQAAKRRMSELSFQRDVLVRWTKRDRFGRIVGVALVGGKDVGLALIESGLAWHFKRYAHEQPISDRASYARAEELARAARIGLWREQGGVPPWEYRRHMKQGGVRTPGDLR
jgi:endonuclease YncB( thermonuclease family)